jgi:hypothetical protein
MGVDPLAQHLIRVLGRALTAGSVGLVAVTLFATTAQAATSPSPDTAQPAAPSPAESAGSSPSPSPRSPGAREASPTPSATPTPAAGAATQTPAPSPSASPSGSVKVLLDPSTVAPGGQLYVAASCSDSGTATSAAFPTASMRPGPNNNGVVAVVAVSSAIKEAPYQVAVRCQDGSQGSAVLTVRFPAGGLDTGGARLAAHGPAPASPPAMPAAAALLAAALVGATLAGSVLLAARRSRPKRWLAAGALGAGSALLLPSCLWFGTVESGRIHPTKIDIDSINVHAPVSGTGLNQSYQVAIPPFDKPGETAWYQNSAVPGGQGSAMITGHLDTSAGPAVFKNLNRMKPGDLIKVTLSDNSQVTFQASAVSLYPKSNFPSQRVYGASDVPALNLVTCAGAYNQSAGGYLSNLVVFSRKVS